VEAIDKKLKKEENCLKYQYFEYKAKSVIQRSTGPAQENLIQNTQVESKLISKL
jgi:hypothetical protein